jgi:hypothetical protein
MIHKSFLDKIKEREQSKKIAKISSSVFPWESIRVLCEEEQHSFLKNKLIESVVSINKDSINQKLQLLQPNSLLKRFAERFECKTIVPGELFESSSLITNKKKVNPKKKKGIDVEKTKLENEILFQDKDFNQFFLQKGLKLKQGQIFTYPVNHYLYLLYWCIEIIRSIKAKKSVPPTSILDACISLDRFLQTKQLTNESYFIAFNKVQKNMNKLINAQFYSLFFQNPYLLTKSSFESIGSEIKLHPEQQEMILDLLAAIGSNRPLLYGNQHSTGNGKTFCAAPMSKILSIEFPKKVLLFACSNELVRNSLASDVLQSNNPNLWLAKQSFVVNKDNSRKAQFLIRPHKSSYPNNWKKIYNADDDRKIGNISKQFDFFHRVTGRYPTMIIADLPSCLELLKFNEVLGYPFVGYIDEFITTEEDAKIMGEIAFHFPKQTVILSSVLPRFQNMPSVVEVFCSKYKTDVESSCKRVSSYNIKIPAAIIDKNGYVAFPHHFIKSEDELNMLIDNLSNNPRLRRSYPAMYVYQFSQIIKEELPEALHFQTMFPTIGSINQNDITQYVIMLLEFLMGNFHLLNLFQNYKPRKLVEKVNTDDIFTRSSFLFDTDAGKTLCIFSEPTKAVHELTMELFEGREKLSSILKKHDMMKKEIEQKIKSKEKKKTQQQSSSTFDKKLNEEDTQDLKTEMETMRVGIAENMIINHTDHFHRFHSREEDRQPPLCISYKEICLPEENYDIFSEQQLYELFSTIGVYDNIQQSKYQRESLMKLYNQISFFCAGKAIIYGTNLSSLVNVYIPKEFADTCSTTELYQLIGRVGRCNTSSHATIFTTDDLTLERLLSCGSEQEEETEVENEVRSLLLFKKKKLN